MQSASSAGHIAHVSLGKQRCEVEMLALYTLSLKQAKEMSLNISALRPGSNAPPEEAFSQLCSLLGGGGACSVREDFENDGADYFEVSSTAVRYPRPHGMQSAGLALGVPLARHLGAGENLKLGGSCNGSGRGS